MAGPEDVVKSGLPTTAIMAGLGIGMAVGFALFFKISITAIATYERTTDAAYPYLSAISMHTVNNQPFLYYLSEALRMDSEIVEGVNVKDVLVKFNETFELVNNKDEIIISTGEKDGNRAYLAVPPGGRLVMIYDS